MGPRGLEMENSRPGFKAGRTSACEDASGKGTNFPVPGSRPPPTHLLLSHSSPGGLVCLTTRTNPSNLRYKEVLEATLDRLEQAGAWERLVARPVDQWELATSELEVRPGTSDSDGFISGIIYLYRKQAAAQAEGGRPGA